MNIFENKIIQIIFFPISIVYGFTIRIRNFCYDSGIFSIKKIDTCKILSVGNISVGGTGKTPVVKFLADLLHRSGVKVAILSRGYGRKSKGTVIVSNGKEILANIDDSGDEPLLLAKQLRSIPVVVEADRYKGALLIAKKFSPDVILLDDAYQHRRIFRDLNIAIIDASQGFGNGYLLPAGFLREPITSLKRADLIWYTRIDQEKDFVRLQKIVHKVTTVPKITSSYAPVKLIQMNTKEQFNLPFLRSKNVLLVSGIANHTSFENTVIEMGADVVHHLKFSDHHHYRVNDIKKIISTFHSINAEIILTTEKDYYRLAELVQNLTDFFYLEIEIKIEAGYETLVNKLSANSNIL